MDNLGGEHLPMPGISDLTKLDISRLLECVWVAIELADLGHGMVTIAVPVAGEYLVHGWASIETATIGEYLGHSLVFVETTGAGESMVNGCMSPEVAVADESLRHGWTGFTEGVPVYKSVRLVWLGAYEIFGGILCDFG